MPTGRGGGQASRTGAGGGGDDKTRRRVYQRSGGGALDALHSACRQGIIIIVVSIVCHGKSRVQRIARLSGGEGSEVSYQGWREEFVQCSSSTTNSSVAWTRCASLSPCHSRILLWVYSDG